MVGLGAISEIHVKIGADTDPLKNAISSAKSDVRGFGTSVKSLLPSPKFLAVGAAAAITGIGVAAIKAAIDFESAFAGVRKTVDATEEQFAELEQSFRDMATEIPVTVGELAQIGEAAGQLGIDLENIEEFTRVMADLGVATNLSSTEAATALARLANITQLPQEEFDRLGSTIVELGNNLATTEAEIVEMGLRLAGAGAQIGLTEAEILAFAGALSSVGIQAQAGGTAISRVFIEMANATRGLSDDTRERVDNVEAIEEETERLETLEKQLMLTKLRQGEFSDETRESTRVANQMTLDRLNKDIEEQKELLDELTVSHGTFADDSSTNLDKFAEVAGVTSAEFSKAFEEDAAGAMIIFLQGLKRIDEEGGNVFKVLEELGFAEVRVRDALLRASGAGDLFSESIELGSKAWEENTALTEEAEKRYGTAESQLQIMKNGLNEVFIEMGEKLLPTLVELLPVLTDLIVVFGEVAVPILETLTPALETMVDILENAVNGFKEFSDDMGQLWDAIPDPLKNLISKGGEAAFAVPGGLIDVLAGEKTLKDIDFTPPGLAGPKAARGAISDIRQEVTIGSIEISDLAGGVTAEDVQKAVEEGISRALEGESR
jgi:hypothetical protein